MHRVKYDVTDIFEYTEEVKKEKNLEIKCGWGQHTPVATCFGTPAHTCEPAASYNKTYLQSSPYPVPADSELLSSTYSWTPGFPEMFKITNKQEYTVFTGNWIIQKNCHTQGAIVYCDREICGMYWTYNHFNVTQLRISEAGKDRIHDNVPTGFIFIGLSFEDGDGDSLDSLYQNYTNSGRGNTWNADGVNDLGLTEVGGLGSGIYSSDTNNFSSLIGGEYGLGGSSLTVSIDSGSLNSSAREVTTENHTICSTQYTEATVRIPAPKWVYLIYDRPQFDQGQGNGEDMSIPFGSGYGPTAISTSGYGGGSHSFSSSADELDIIYIPSNLPTYAADGTYLGDLAYSDIDGIVITEDGVYYYPEVRINNITNSLTDADLMEFAQYAKFDDTPKFEEGQLIYGVIAGVVKFGGHIMSVNYTLSDREQIIRYTAVGFRKNFEDAPWVFNYKDENTNTIDLLNKVLAAAPPLYYRGTSGEVKSISIPEIEFTNQNIGGGVSAVFNATGKYGWYLGPDKIFRIYKLDDLPIENIYVAEEGNALSEHSEYNVINLNLNYNLTDRITRLIIRGDYKMTASGSLVKKANGDLQYLLYDTGWVGTAYSRFNIQNVRTIIEPRFKWIEGIRNDQTDMQDFANLFISPFKDSFIGGTCTLDGINLNLAIGKSVKIHNTSMGYLDNQELVIYSVKYNLDDKSTELSLSSNYWFGTGLTSYFKFLEYELAGGGSGGYGGGFREPPKPAANQARGYILKLYPETDTGRVQVYMNWEGVGKCYFIAIDHHIKKRLLSSEFFKGDYICINFEFHDVWTPPPHGYPYKEYEIKDIINIKPRSRETWW